MIRLYLTFIITCIIIHYSITAFRKATGKQRLEFGYQIAYSFLITILATALLTAIVVIF